MSSAVAGETSCGRGTLENAGRVCWIIVKCNELVDQTTAECSVSHKQPQQHGCSRQVTSASQIHKMHDLQSQVLTADGAQFPSTSHEPSRLASICIIIAADWTGNGTGQSLRLSGPPCPRNEFDADPDIPD